MTDNQQKVLYEVVPENEVPEKILIPENWVQGFTMGPNVWLRPIAALSAPAGEREEGKWVSTDELYRLSLSVLELTKWQKMVAEFSGLGILSHSLEQHREELKKATTPPTGKAAGVWVYESDPNFEGFYYCKTINDFGKESKQVVKFSKQPVYAGRKWDTHYQIIAYLDESAQPSETGEGKFAEWAQENEWTWYKENNKWMKGHCEEDDCVITFEWKTTASLMAEYQQYLLNNK